MSHTDVHILRHTFCSYLALHGVPLHVIKELAGHKSIQTTMRYAHLVPDAKDDAIRTVEAAHLGQHLDNERNSGSKSGG